MKTVKIPTTRICKDCKIEKKLIEDFYKKRDGFTLRSFTSRCKKCHCKALYERYLLNHPKQKTNYIQDLDGETWKDVIGYEGLYKVSNLGRVKGYERIVNPNFGNKEKMVVSEHVLTHSIDNRGSKYHRVTLSVNGVSKTYSVHRLVAIAFIPNPQNKPQVNHLNRNVEDNRVENLEWCTAHENTTHYLISVNYQRKYFPRQRILKYDKKGNFICEYYSMTYAIKNIGIGYDALKSIISGKENKKHEFVYKIHEDDKLNRAHYKKRKK